jgi:hypothetical protein
MFVVLLSASCSSSETPTLSAEFHDDFERAELGPNWNNTGGPYKIVDGELHVAGARNHPLWLKKRLPDDIRVSFDVRSDSAQGDIKFELFGDGRSFARESSYVATGYVLIFGGWRNSKTIIARLDEHGADVRERRDVKVVQGRKYAFKAERRGGLLRWWVDDELMLEYDDVQPLKGRQHDHFAINNWETPLYFDNIRISPL